MTTLEIAVTELEDASASALGEADSVELSIDLHRDGLTPPMPLVHEVRHQVAIDVHVIIRPHDRDFIYTPDEIEGILSTAHTLNETTITGIVFGAHLPDSRFDVDLVKRVRDAAPNLQFTLHRALDSCRNPEEALDALQGTIDRALTSGPAKTAWEGRAGLKKWVDAFGTKIDFIAAGSVTLAQLPALVTETGVSGIHCGSAARINGEVSWEQVKRLKTAMSS
ncbi:MAG: copper homeostasis protein CutC [Aggregatilineales bacterium]